MPQLTLSRTREWINKLNEVALYLNDEKIGTLKNGEAKSFDILPGEYRLETKFEKYSSNILTLHFGEGDAKTIHLHNYKYAKFSLSALLLVFILGIFFPPAISEWSLPITILFSLRPLYFTTKGRKNYFRLIPLGEQTGEARQNTLDRASA